MLGESGLWDNLASIDLLCFDICKLVAVGKATLFAKSKQAREQHQCCCCCCCLSCCCCSSCCCCYCCCCVWLVLLPYLAKEAASHILGPRVLVVDGVWDATGSWRGAGLCHTAWWSGIVILARAKARHCCVLGDLWLVADRACGASAGWKEK